MDDVLRKLAASEPESSLTPEPFPACADVALFHHVLEQEKTWNIRRRSSARNAGDGAAVTKPDSAGTAAITPNWKPDSSSCEQLTWQHSAEEQQNGPTGRPGTGTPGSS